MAGLIAIFDDARGLEKATKGLAEADLDGWVIDEMGQVDEQPLPPEIGAASQVPLATPQAVTAHDVALPGREAGPRGASAAALEDLMDETGIDDEAAERYRRLVAGGATLLVVRGDEGELARAEELIRSAGSNSLARFG